MRLDKDTNPAIVIYKGDFPPKDVREIAIKALFKTVRLRDAWKIINSSKKFLYFYMGNGRGIIGALSAIGNILINRDHTYELLAYRKPENIGKKRRIDEKSVIDAAGNPNIFANYDPETRRILITPRGGDPVLFGIRGETPEDVYKAFLKIRSLEEIDRWAIFVTNQGTDDHWRQKKSIKSIKPFEQVIIEGVLDKNPSWISGGHVILKIQDKTGRITSMVYFESGGMTKKVRNLRAGDKIRIYGGVKEKKELTINVQKIEILRENDEKEVKPICIRCHKPMRSLGKGKGYFCKCGYHLSLDVSLIIHLKREIRPRLLLPPYRSIRHLTKPIKRYGREHFRNKINITFHPWCSFLENTGISSFNSKRIII
ncbi:DNA-binding protein [Candidatus Geothermarchaeota archaeon]|nr:MAG: DNA-binding protein [Candidatus Geothermarchaeota archaeon]